MRRRPGDYSDDGHDEVELDEDIEFYRGADRLWLGVVQLLSADHRTTASEIIELES